MSIEKLRNKQGLTEEEFLARYDAGKFERPSVTVDVLVFAVGSELKLLLIRRGDHPCLGQWALPGGFVNMDESLDEAAARELMEETGVEDLCLEQLSTWGDVGRDPRTRIISTAYLALLPADRMARAGDDAAEAGWVRVDAEILAEQCCKTEKGSFSEKVVRIHLDSGTVRLSADVKVSLERIGLGTRVKQEVIESKGIAFDHGKIIQSALQRVRERMSEKPA